MWGFTADTAAQHLCRGLDAATGYFPKACLVDAGRPALAIGAIVTLAALICVAMLRSAVSRV